MNSVRTVKIDDIAIRTNLSAIEIASLPKINAELMSENENLSKEVDMWNTKYNEVCDENKRLIANGEKLKMYLQEQYIFITSIPSITKEIALEHKIMANCYKDMLDKMEELEVGKLKCTM